MLSTKENLKQIEMDTIQQEPLLTELTPEASAVVQGGVIRLFRRDNINFDTLLSTPTFTVRPGGSISLSSSTQSGNNNRFFSAAVRNVNTGNSTPPKSVLVGNGTVTTWTGIRGGSYKIDLTDTKDNIFVSGRILVSYDS